MAGPGAPATGIGADRRILALVLAAAAVAAPAVVLRLLCVGRSCPEPEGPAAPVPFCSLPDDTRRLITDGFRTGRSPDVLAVAAQPVRGGRPGVEEAAWPVAQPSASRVLLAVAGAGVSRGAAVPDGTTLDAVAPTIAEIIGLVRPHPSVRSGVAIDGAADASEIPRLLLLVVWKGVGGAELEAQRESWPVLRSLLSLGAGTISADAGSLPVDTAAVLTTIGTGGLPRQHGITGTLLRNDEGRVAEAWGPGSPVSVIAALGDDLDEARQERPRIGVVGTDPADRGVIGGTWYLDTGDDDDVVIVDPAAAAEEAGALLATGYGADGETDLLAVVMEGPIRRLDHALGELASAARDVAGDALTVVVTSTGSYGAPGAASADAIERAVERRVGLEAVEAMAVGGAFLNRQLLGGDLSVDEVVRALRGIEDDGEPLLADAFPALAVSFGRYC